MNIIWKPHQGPQTEALTRAEFEILYGGARGGGKTDAGMAWLLRHIDNPSYRALIIRKNYDDLTDWIDRARMMYRGTGAEFVGKPVEIKFPSGAIFRGGHLKDPHSYEKYLGQEYQRMVVEELTLIPREEDYEKLLFSCRSTIPSIKPQVFATTNPGGAGHSWVKNRFIDQTEWGKPYTYSNELKNPLTGEKMFVSRSRIFIHAQVEDNPTLISSDPGYVLMLDNLKGSNPGLYRAWRFGDWNIPAGQVFSEFRYDTHVVSPFEIPATWNKWLAYDHGINNPFSLGFYAEDFDGRVYLVDELYMNGEDFQNKFGMPFSAARLAKIAMLLAKKKGWDYQYMVCDPSLWNKAAVGKIKDDGFEGESAAEIMLSAGLKLIKGDNDRINGLLRYREALSQAPDGKPYYQIFSNCKDTIRTIPSLVYDVAKGKMEDVDTEGEDHCYDRDRYFFMSRPAMPTKVERPKTRLQEYKLRVRRGEKRYSDEYYETI